MTTKNRFYMRRFLNKPGYHAGAYVLAAVEDTSKSKDDAYPWSDVCFTIADCGKQISLDFDVNEHNLENSLYKCDILIETLINFRIALEQEGELNKKRSEAAREAKERKQVKQNS